MSRTRSLKLATSWALPETLAARMLFQLVDDVIGRPLLTGQPAETMLCLPVARGYQRVCGIRDDWVRQRPIQATTRGSLPRAGGRARLGALEVVLPMVGTDSDGGSPGLRREIHPALDDFSPNDQPDADRLFIRTTNDDLGIERPSGCPGH